MTTLRSHSAASRPCALHPGPLHHTPLHDYPQPSSPRPQPVLPAAAIFLSPPPLRALRRSNLKNPLYKLTICQNKNSFTLLLSQGCLVINRTKKLSLSDTGFTGQINTSGLHSTGSQSTCSPFRSNPPNPSSSEKSKSDEPISPPPNTGNTRWHPVPIRQHIALCPALDLPITQFHHSRNLLRRRCRPYTSPSIGGCYNHPAGSRQQNTIR